MSPNENRGNILDRNGVPRLLYIGDLPVEASSHGSALLYRLLQDYPPDKLMIVEAGGVVSLPARRLPEVPYRQFSMLGQRLQRTRFSRWANGWFVLRMAARVRGMRRLFHGFDPQAVLTVAHDLSWLAAAEIARQGELPLHLIVHDDWPSSVFVPPGFTDWQNREFRRIYRQAAARLCVSPSMEEEYRSRYGIPGQVLYPSRAKDYPRFDTAPDTYTKRQGPLVVAYAGNPGCREMILSVAKCLEKTGGQMLLFGPHYCESMRSGGLDRPNIHWQGMVSSSELISRLRREADVVFAPMPFDTSGGPSLSFPSKLTDYTATGLPLLIWGPDYCTAVRWARQYAPVAEVVTSQETGDLEAALERLGQAEHRRRLGLASMEVGTRLFSHAAAVDTLFGVLQGLAASPLAGR